MRGLVLFVGVLALMLPWSGAYAQTAPAVSPGQTALDGAARTNKYTFFLFYKQDDDTARTMRQELDKTLAKRTGQAVTARVRATDPAEKHLIDRYSLSRAPMPLVLAVAPNGAVTGAFALKLTEQDVAGAFVTPAAAACLKAVQARKLVLLCVQPAGSTELPAGVREFKADSNYGPATEVVTLRANDPGETTFLQALKVKPGSAPVTAFLAPPGRLLGTFQGTVTRQQLVEKLKAASQCCPGGKCGPGGCCGKQ